jgi:hypothetical protein
MRMPIRWFVAAVAPICVVAAMASASASAGLSGEQLISHDSQAYYHCTSGSNQNGTQTNHCFYTPNSVNAEAGYWWIRGLNEAWLDSGHNWIKNTSDFVLALPWTNWWDVYGP